MACRNIHAATVFAYIFGMASVAGLITATVAPNWRLMRLISFNKNAKNVSVSIGLWIKCFRIEGDSECALYETDWYSNMDQLDLRVLQFALPFSIFFASLAALLCLIGICNTAFGREAPNINLAKCLVNSAGCHLVAALLFFLSGALSLTPSVWVIFQTNDMNKKYASIYATSTATYLAIASAGGMLFTSCLLMLWYCACKALPSPFWQPLPSQPASVHSYPSHSYASPPYSSRSRLSTIEIDIPVVTQVS
ncbi:claudin-12 [Polypterus senegalus]